MARLFSMEVKKKFLELNPEYKVWRNQKLQKDVVYPKVGEKKSLNIANWSYLAMDKTIITNVARHNPDVFIMTLAPIWRCALPLVVLQSPVGFVWAHRNTI